MLACELPQRFHGNFLGVRSLKAEAGDFGSIASFQGFRLRPCLQVIDVKGDLFSPACSSGR